MTKPTLPDLSFQDDSKQVLARAQRDGVVIFGSGKFARALKVALSHLNISVTAFVVTQGHATTLEGIPVLPVAESVAVNGNRNIWVGVFNHQPNANYDTLNSICLGAGFEHIVFPTQFFELVAPFMGWRFWLTHRADYRSNEKEIRVAFERLEDDQSKQLFADTLSYRLGKALHIPGTPCQDLHYFPDFITVPTRNAGRPLTLLDGGAYDGDTIATALSRLPLAQAYAFEPDATNFRSLTQRAKTLEVPVVCFPCGLSSSTQTLRFCSGQGEASTISSAGEETIQVVSIDDCLPNSRVDYLKFDVEGHEMEALQGAAHSIRRHRPLLAIAGYHRASDLWRIPNFIHSLELGYRVRLRIHTENSFEAVFYAY
jgi:FkbM family methyltransferase